MGSLIMQKKPRNWYVNNVYDKDEKTNKRVRK